MTEKCELSRFCGYLNTMPRTINNRGPEVANAAIVISMIACFVDGDFNYDEIKYINRLIGYEFI